MTFYKLKHFLGLHLITHGKFQDLLDTFMFIQPTNYSSVQVPAICQYCARHFEFRKLNKTVDRLKFSGLQTFPHITDYFINFNLLTHIPFILVYLHLR